MRASVPAADQIKWCVRRTLENFSRLKSVATRLTRHSWCVRRTLRREITFLSADWYNGSAAVKAGLYQAQPGPT